MTGKNNKRRETGGLDSWGKLPGRGKTKPPRTQNIEKSRIKNNDSGHSPAWRGLIWMRKDRYRIGMYNLFLKIISGEYHGTTNNYPFSYFYGEYRG